MCFLPPPRNRGYDGHELVDRFLNQAHVKQEMGIAANVTWLSCSLEVDAVLGHDMMHSVSASSLPSSANSHLSSIYWKLGE